MTAPGRLVGVDVARGVALLGMAAVHVFPEDAPRWVHRVADGRAAALFAVLAGVGLALLSGGPRPRAGGGLLRSVATRALLVALVGLVLGGLDSGVAVVLAYYGVLFVVALPLLRLRARPLALLAAGCAVVTPVVSFLLRPHLPPRSAGNASFGMLAADPAGFVWTLLVTGYYPVLCWTAYLCAGLAAGRLALTSPRVQLRLAGVGAALVVLAPALSAVLLGPLGGLRHIAAVTPVPPGESVGALVAQGQYGNVPTSTPWWLATDGPHASTPLDLLRTIGSALLVLGVALLLTRLGLLRRLLSPLAAMGAMTLTLYSLHVLVLTATSGGAPLQLWWVQVVVGAVLAVLWLRTSRRGPLETVVATAAGR